MDKIINFLNENGIEMEIFNGNEFAQDVPEEVKETYETMIKLLDGRNVRSFLITFLDKDGVQLLEVNLVKSYVQMF